MRKRPSTAPAASSRSFRLAGAVVALLAIGASAAQAANPAPAPAAAAAGEGYCPLIKNAAARALCQTSRKQFYGKNYRAALITMKQAVSLSPKEGVLHVMIARLDGVFGNVGGEERELREAHVLGAPDDLVLPELFDALIERHDENRLLIEFPDPAPGTKGDNAGYIYQGRAKALLSLGRVDEAATAMDHALALHRDIPGLLDRARMATRQNNKALATKLVDEAYQSAPKDGMAMSAKLQQIQATDDTAKTLAFSEQMLGLFPTRIDVRVVRVQTFLKLNQTDKAKAEVDAILALAPKNVFAIYYSGILLARANDKAGAWQWMLQLPPIFVQKNPTLGPAIAQIGFDTGHDEVGATILANVLSAAPDMLDVRLQLAGVRLKQNSPQSALTVLTPVKDSHDPRVQKLLAATRAEIANTRSN